MKTVVKKLLGILVVVALIIGAIALRMHRKHQQESVRTAEMPPWALRVTTVKKQTVSRTFPVLATVLTSEEITISGRLQGEILSMGPREGQTVKKGELLATIDTRDIDQQILSMQAKLAAAQADLLNKKDQYERVKKLLAKGGVSIAASDAAEAAYRVAQHSVESLKRSIAGLKIRRSYARITSPSDGTISARLAEPGSLCTPAHPLYRITQSRGARVRVTLPQHIISELKPNTPLVLQAGGQSQTVTLSRIFPSLDARALGAAEADAKKAPFGLQSGARVPGNVILDQRENALFLPHEAVLVSSQDAQQGVVFLVVSDAKNSGNERHLRKVPVTIDLRSSRGLSVLGDIHAGDQAVTAHDAVLLKLHDGDLVRIIADAQ